MPADWEGEVYSLVLSIDHVERAFYRDSVSEMEYTEAMARLLSRYARQEPHIESSTGTLDRFYQHFHIDGLAGLRRIQIGIPATSEADDLPTQKLSALKTRDMSDSSVQPSTKAANGKALLRVAGNFITFSDGVQLEYRSKSDLHPLLAELATSLNSVTKENFNGRQKLVEWLIKLNQLKTGESLTDEEAKQCLSDVQEAYQSFQLLLD